MDEKDRFAALMELAKFRMDVREKRMSRQWRVTLGLWTLLAASIAYLRPQSTWALIVMWFVLVVIHAILWVRTNNNSSERDARRAYYHAELAERIIHPGPAPDLPRPINRWDFLMHEPNWFALIATALLGLAVIVASRGG